MPNKRLVSTRHVSTTTGGHGVHFAFDHTRFNKSTSQLFTLHVKPNASKVELIEAAERMVNQIKESLQHEQTLGPI